MPSQIWGGGYEQAGGGKANVPDRAGAALQHGPGLLHQFPPGDQAVALHAQPAHFLFQRRDLPVEHRGKAVQRHAPQQGFHVFQFESAVLVIFQHRDLQQRVVVVIAIAGLLVHKAGGDHAFLVEIAQLGGGDRAQPADLADGIAAVFHGPSPLPIRNVLTPSYQKIRGEKRDICHKRNCLILADRQNQAGYARKAARWKAQPSLSAPFSQRLPQASMSWPSR